MGRMADLFRRHGSAYRAEFAARMPYDQLRTMRAIERCRTAALGGQHWRCPRCGQERWSFHSCGNRHCPACGQDDALAWLRRQEALRLPITYHLCTFTVPQELRYAIRSHPREGLAMLFAASSSTLLDLCAHPKWFGARPGVTGVLHTHTRALLYHPHVHYLVTGGGLAPDGSWREASSTFLVPVRALSPVLRARFRDALRKRLPEVFVTIPKKVWQRDWVVHSESVGNGEQALRYLSRYLYRVALTDSAILAHDEKTVTFREATAHGIITMNAEAFAAVESGTVKKGDVLGVARIAGIMATKRTSELIPLCHPLPLTKVSVDFRLLPERQAVEALCTVKTAGVTGVEMEALTGVSTALLTIYDMCKAVDKGMELGEIHLVEKTGGKSGHYIRAEGGYV